MKESFIEKGIKNEQLMNLFNEWWSIWPAGQKKSRDEATTAWMKVFFKSPKVEEHDWDNYARNTLMQGLKNQVNYRSTIYKKYPTPEERKRHDIFVPHLAQPPRWLNRKLWQDPVPQLPSEKVSYDSVKQSCMDCSEEATILVEGNPLCAWHWTKRYDRPHLKLLAESLEKMGLARLGNESREAWSDRCREYIRGSKWSESVKA
jgi:hypothetical protein